MSDLSIRGPSGTVPLGGINLDGGLQRKERAPQGSGVPPVPPPDLDSDGVPELDPPNISSQSVDDLVNGFLALRLKTGDQQLRSSLGDVKDKGAQMKAKNAEISEALSKASEKLGDAEKSQTAMKVLSWIAVAASVALAVATGGVGAIVCAAVAVTMATLNETGVMQKATDAIAKGLEGTGSPPMSASDAKKWAQGIMIGITIAVSVATIGVGWATSGTQIASLAAKLPAMVGPEMAQKIITGVKVAQALMSIGQGTTGIVGGVNRFEGMNEQAKVMDSKAFLQRLQQKLQDEQDLIKNIVELMNSTTDKVIEAMEGQSETMHDVIQQMRPQTG